MVGATRILRPAVAQLVDAGEGVVGVARTRSYLVALAAESGADFIPIAVDYTDPESLAVALKGVPYLQSGLIYAPNATVATLQVFREFVYGSVVEILTSRVASEQPDQPFDPANLPAAPGGDWHRLVLGWKADRTWHSPSEISDAALRVLRTGVSEQLGLLRPCADRP